MRTELDHALRFKFFFLDLLDYLVYSQLTVECSVYDNLAVYVMNQFFQHKDIVGRIIHHKYTEDFLVDFTQVFFRDKKRGFLIT